MNNMVFDRLAIEDVPKNWAKVEIAFLSDERIEVRVGTRKRLTYNYPEMGFEDRRSGKHSSAWTMLSVLANHD